MAKFTIDEDQANEVMALIHKAITLAYEYEIPAMATIGILDFHKAHILDQLVSKQKELEINHG